MKATFFERLGAYFLDAIIVSLIFSLICLGFGNYTSNTEKLMSELDEKLLQNEITNEEYLEEYQDLLYDYQKENVLQSGISAALTIAYYVIFQYMNKGQTIGKKLLKLRVVDKDTQKPVSILKGLLRSFIVLSILSGTLCIIFLYIFSKNNYLISYTTLLFLEGIFTLITTLLVLYRKDGRGLHDMIANTIVIKESR
jgi:uncharacterized RDD family membrane protein YckC